MEANLKKILFNVVYYSLIAVMVSFVIFFLITLGNASMAEWERIAYYVLAIALLVAVIYDVICTSLRRNKYIAGMLIYVVAMLVVILSLIIMALNSANGRLLIEITERFFRIILFSYIITGLAIAIFCTGEKLITHESNRIKK